MTYGQRLKMARERAGLSAWELVSLLHKGGYTVTLQRYRRLESGQSVLRLDDVVHIAGVLKMEAHLFADYLTLG